MTEDNRVALRGKLVELDVLRHTPAGIPIVNFRLAHQSMQSEAGIERKIDCEVQAVAFGREARLLSGACPGSEITCRGFLDRKGRTKRQLVLHATQIEFELKE